MYSDEELLLLSGIQHFAFCRRQWALIHIEQQWQENSLTVEGDIQHERVHNAHLLDYRNGIITMHDMRIKSNELGISGKCDAVEMHPCESGITLHGCRGQWRVYPVEYKHGRIKISDCDRLQLAAQVMCLEEMFCCEIPEAALFYEETRRREIVTIGEDLRQKVRKITEEMHDFSKRGYTPRVKPHVGCKSCSLIDLCLPSLLNKNEQKAVANYVNNALTEKET